MASRPETKSVVVQMDKSVPLPDPSAVNFFTAARMGMSVSLVAGWFDIHALAERSVREGSVGPNVVRMKPTHHFMMPLDAFFLLHRQVNDMAAALQKEGIVVNPHNENK